MSLKVEAEASQRAANDDAAAAAGSAAGAEPVTAPSQPPIGADLPQTHLPAPADERAAWADLPAAERRAQEARHAPHAVHFGHEVSSVPSAHPTVRVSR